ncbi:MAG: nicotinate (nicotinamide) nucleotide adenylyltransferase [Saprospiraceae bacterium]
MKIGLFFGSFNPIHIGHLIIANYMATQTDLKKVWLVVSPQNPLKPRKSLAPDNVRLQLARMAIEDNSALEASSVEFGLPKPSYTIDTLTYLKEKYPEREFVLIMGSDNLETLTQWKNYEKILTDYHIYVYKRPGYAGGQFDGHPRVRFFEAPPLDISATYIRECLRHDRSIRYMTTDNVWEFLSNSSNLYKVESED